ncbi:hypothetical protein R0J90_16065, partial [Micrococcus sp. SIMBA_144]
PFEHRVVVIEHLRMRHESTVRRGRRHQRLVRRNYRDKSVFTVFDSWSWTPSPDPLIPDAAAGPAELPRLRPTNSSAFANSAGVDSDTDT